MPALLSAGAFQAEKKDFPGDRVYDRQEGRAMTLTPEQRPRLEVKGNQAKPTIIKADAELREKGYEIVSGLPYDSAAITARYLIRSPSGEVVAMTTSQVRQIIGR